MFQTKRRSRKDEGKKKQIAIEPTILSSYIAGPQEETTRDFLSCSDCDAKLGGFTGPEGKPFYLGGKRLVRHKDAQGIITVSVAFCACEVGKLFGDGDPTVPLVGPDYPANQAVEWAYVLDDDPWIWTDYRKLTPISEGELRGWRRKWGIKDPDEVEVVGVDGKPIEKDEAQEGLPF